MTTLTPLPESLAFPPIRSVHGRLSIADLVPANRRCGIYVLHFATGELYAGQALDVTRRYTQHCKTYNDITHISFKPMLKTSLNDEERRTIWTLEQASHALRNITFTSTPKGETDLDFVVTPEEQAAWKELSTHNGKQDRRTNDVDLRRKYAPRFQQFLKKSAAEMVMKLLRTYVQFGLPYPKRTELSFWSASCLPSYSDTSIIIYTRININWQEIYTISAEKNTPKRITLSLHVARSPLEEVYGSSLDGLFKHHPDLEYSEHFYEPGGHDQINLVLQNPRHIQLFFTDPAVQKAIRLFNLRLMQKGPCAYSRYHCFDLADQIVT